MKYQVKDLLDPGLLPDSDTARLDLEVLLAHALDKTRTYLYTWPEHWVESDIHDKFAAMVQRRQKGEPVAHIIKAREFWSLSLSVNPSTLIPRPDTEILIEAVLDRNPGVGPRRILDLGTGTGAIALALAFEKKSWQVFGLDASEDACMLAEKNRNKLGLANTSFFCGSWFDALASVEFDIIVSNPPYIPSNDPHLLEGDVRFEPLSALVSGDDGLDDIRMIVNQSPSHLSSGGYLFIEHGYDQLESVQGLFEEAGFSAVDTVFDYGGNPRITLGFKK